MLKECAKRRLVITSFALIIFFITLSFPKTTNEENSFSISYENGYTTPVYLLNKENLVVRTSMPLQSKEILDLVTEITNILTIDHPKSAYIPTIFEPILPKETKILSMDIQDHTLKINFNEEILSIPKEYEEKLIECLVYNYTEIEGIEGVILFINGKLLSKLPHSGKSLPPLLTRDIGINKIYNLNSIKNVTKTTAYYLAKDENQTFYIPVTLLDNNDKNKVEIIIERLKSLPHENTNLMSYLNASTELSNYEILEEEVKLSFSPFLYEGLSNETVLEEVKYSISLSLKDTLNVKEVTFLEN